MASVVLIICQCDNPWHLKCLDPPLDAIPDGEWFCPDCEDDIGGAVVVGQGRKPKKSGQKRKAQEKPSPGKFIVVWTIAERCSQPVLQSPNGESSGLD